MKASLLVLMGSLLSLNSLAAEVACSGNDWSFIIEKNDDQKIGSLVFRHNLLERVEMVKKSVRSPELQEVKALYEGKTSTDSYKLYIFKEKENQAYISFLESESILGDKKVIELRCNLK